MRETGRYGVEAYLKKQVALAGGATRKFASTHRPNNPDQIVIWPRPTLGWATIDFVETKAPGKKARAGQLREHKRLRKLGCQVHIVDTKAKVDAYVKANR